MPDCANLPGSLGVISQHLENFPGPLCGVFSRDIAALRADHIGGELKSNPSHRHQIREVRAILDNPTGRTDIPSGKGDEIFSENENGVPMFSGRLGFRHRKFGEIGFSGLGGIYNVFRIEGEKVAPRRRMRLLAADFLLKYNELTIQGEFAWARVDVDDQLSEQFGENQWGGFVDLIYPILKRRMLGFDKAVLNGTIRLENVDLNTGNFSNESGLLTDTKIFDDVRAIVAGIGFRPSANTIIRANYRYHWTRDFLGNPTIKSANLQFGLATYF